MMCARETLISLQDTPCYWYTRRLPAHVDSPAHGGF
jgi:hypothetical protein